MMSSKDGEKEVVHCFGCMAMPEEGFKCNGSSDCYCHKSGAPVGNSGDVESVVKRVAVSEQLKKKDRKIKSIETQLKHQKRVSEIWRNRYLQKTV